MHRILSRLFANYELPSRVDCIDFFQFDRGSVDDGSAIVFLQKVPTRPRSASLKPVSAAIKPAVVKDAR